MDGRETIPELMRDARGELADGGQTFFQAQLLFEPPDFGEIGEQANRSMKLGPIIEKRRDGHAEMRRPALGFGQLDRPPRDRRPRREAFVDQIRENWNVEKMTIVVHWPRVRNPQHATASRVQDLDLAP